MPGKTTIEWANYSWNPIKGCSRVSAGCEHCFAEAQAARFCGPGQPFAGFAQRVHGKPHWTGRVELVESALYEPLRWRKPAVIFVNSMSDLFHPELPDDSIDRVFGVMAECSRHTFIVLTKRPGRMTDWVAKWAIWESPRPLPNVWLGVSIEDQTTADERMPLLLQVAALGWQTFVSYEPALGHVDWGPWLWEDLPPETLAGPVRPGWDRARRNAIGVIIAGGESGPGARPAHPGWFRATRDQCAEAGVAFYFKQWGAWAEVAPETHNIRVEARFVRRGDVLMLPNGRLHMLGATLSAPEPFEGPATPMRLVGKRAAGRLLDGREHNDLPWKVT